MQTIRLPSGEWRFDPTKQIGRKGGFGSVFVGEADGFEPLAIKRLHVSAADAAHRELKLAQDLAGRQFNHVIPILDAGQDADSDGYFVVMPRADQSLADAVKHCGHMDDKTSAKVLLEIATGLMESRHIVHRDLKPDNVLLLDGRWVIADFGIARFIEDSTSINTLKNCLTRAYAAPEQWKHERATTATDLYALGCVGCFLLTGNPPFPGPEFATQHQHDTPPTLDGHLPQLCSLITSLLRKPQQSRPSIERVVDILTQIVNADAAPTSPALQALARAGAKDAHSAAKNDAARAVVSTVKQSRQDLAAAAIGTLSSLVDRLFTSIESFAPTAKRNSNPSNLTINLGNATLRIDWINAGTAMPAGSFPRCSWDVITAAGIKVQQHNPRYEWGASLWYTNFDTEGEFRWRECSYFENAMVRPDKRRHRQAPFFLHPKDADDAHGPALGRDQVAYGPFEIDDESFNSFRDRWCELLAEASQGKLQRPSYMPITRWDR